MKSISEVSEFVSQLVRKREAFELEFELSSFEDERGGFREAVAETFEAVVDAETLQTEPPKGLSQMLHRTAFPETAQKRLFFLEKRDLFDSVVERNFSRTRKLLSSGFSERAYFFSLEREEQSLKLVGFEFKARLFSFNRAFVEEDESLISLFLKLREKEAVESLTVDALNRVVYSLYSEAEEKGIESALESKRFQVLFEAVREPTLKLIFGREYPGRLGHLRCRAALGFARIILEEELPEKWQRLGPYLPFAKDHIRVLAKICKRDPEALSRAPKFVLERARSGRRSSRLL